MEDLISVIMAVYNCADTIELAITSIMNQTYQNFELIICDDASTDGTRDIVKKCQKKWTNKIIFIQNDTNQKLPFSLNYCLKYANGKYIARMDGDDISYSDRFEKQINFLKNHSDIQLVGTGMDVFNGYSIIGKVKKSSFPDYRRIFKETPFCHATIMTYKYVYDELNGYSLNPIVLRNEDLDLWFRFFEKGFKGANIQTSLYRVTDDENAMKRRSMHYRINTSKVLYNGFKILDFPFYYIVQVYLPILKGLCPKRIYNFLRNRKFK